jgi:hypothetical protein
MDMSVSFKDLGNQGRMGNMMFQMSATISLALDNNDTFVFPPWKYEPYFNLHNCFSNNIIISSTYQEPNFTYNSIPYKSGINLVGYFQSQKYFERHADFIRQAFTTNYKIEPQTNATSMHVRRGDYLKFADCHTNLDMNYYQRAMSLCPSEKYYIFSDDISWCKSQFVGNQFVFMENNHETFDMDMMSKCQNNIIANSSFSWFGAWLNTNPSKMVVAPQNWFGPALSHDTRDLIPSTWTQI